MLRFILDEHLRGLLWQSLLRHQFLQGAVLDATRVGDPIDLPLGSSDEQILRWAEREDRILITQDVSTMPVHLATHLADGRTSPGVLVVRRDAKPREVIEAIELIAFAGVASEYANAVRYIP